MCVSVGLYERKDFDVRVHSVRSAGHDGIKLAGCTAVVLVLRM